MLARDSVRGDRSDRQGKAEDRVRLIVHRALACLDRQLRSMIGDLVDALQL